MPICRSHRVDTYRGTYWTTGLTTNRCHAPLDPPRDGPVSADDWCWTHLVISSFYQFTISINPRVTVPVCKSKVPCLVARLDPWPSRWFFFFSTFLLVRAGTEEPQRGYVLEPLESSALQMTQIRPWFVQCAWTILTFKVRQGAISCTVGGPTANHAA